jgi:NTP pyrophosphatase (non-canonical NTP hydrolase)
MQELINKVESWASDRKIIPNSTPQAQLLKTVSELGELADCTLKNHRAGIIDGVGDVIVTLVIYAALQGVKLEDCLASAYGEIKDRRGHLTPEGVFVKEESDA